MNTVFVAEYNFVSSQIFRFDLVSQLSSELSESIL